MASADFCAQAKAFDETKAGVKGLADAGIKDLPAMFHADPAILANPKPPSTLLTIPTIDLKGGILNNADQDPIERKSVVEKIGEASAKLGFFQVINHGIPVDVMNKMRQGICDFHEQDLELKKPFYSRDHQSRSLVYYSNVDLHSSETANWRDTFACYMAPVPPTLEELPAVCGEIMLEYSRQMTKLGELLFELLAEALGLKPSYFKDIECAKYQMMLGQYYPPCPRPDLTLGLSKHADFSFLTVLLQANIGGLQVLYDDYWIDVPPIPEAFVINIGDLLQLVTNDRFISSEHRVLANASNGPRASVPYFFSSFKRENHRVYGPIKELLSEENPAKYREFTISEFAKIFNSKEIFTRKILHFRI